MKCTLLNGFCTEHRKEVHERHRGMFDIFFGIQHRLRKEEMEEQFNIEAMEGWSFAVDAARGTDERASTEDQKHTSDQKEKTARVRTQGPVKEIARVRTQGPWIREPRKHQPKGGGCEKKRRGK